MDRLERNVNRVYTLSGLVLLTIVIMAMSSCGVNRGLTNEQIEQRNKIDYELDKVYLEYSHQRDSLIMEFYNINKK